MSLPRARPGWDELGLLLARVWSLRSYDSKVKVGCVIVSDLTHCIVGAGYNGRGRGEENERESEDQGFSGFIHAEENALLNSTWDPRDSHTIYCTHEPCSHCARCIVNTVRISRVVYVTPYYEENRTLTGLPRGSDILRQCGIIVEQSKIDNEFWLDRMWWL